jgi:hypothetical protein
VYLARTPENGVTFRMVCGPTPQCKLSKIVRVAVAARLGPLLALHRIAPKPLDGPSIILPLSKTGRDRRAVLDGRLKSEPLCLLDLAQLQKRSQSDRVQNATPDRTMRH